MKYFLVSHAPIKYGLVVMSRRSSRLPKQTNFYAQENSYLYDIKKLEQKTHKKQKRNGKEIKKEKKKKKRKKKPIEDKSGKVMENENEVKERRKRKGKRKSHETANIKQQEDCISLPDIEEIKEEETKESIEVKEKDKETKIVSEPKETNINGDINNNNNNNNNQVKLGPKDEKEDESDADDMKRKMLKITFDSIASEPRRPKVEPTSTQKQKKRKRSKEEENKQTKKLQQPKPKIKAKQEREGDDGEGEEISDEVDTIAAEDEASQQLKPVPTTTSSTTTSPRKRRPRKGGSTSGSSSVKWMSQMARNWHNSAAATTPSSSFMNFFFQAMIDEPAAQEVVQTHRRKIMELAQVAACENKDRQSWIHGVLLRHLSARWGWNHLGPISIALVACVSSSQFHKIQESEYASLFEDDADKQVFLKMKGKDFVYSQTNPRLSSLVDILQSNMPWSKDTTISSDTLQKWIKNLRQHPTTKITDIHSFFLPRKPALDFWVCLKIRNEVWEYWTVVRVFDLVQHGWCIDTWERPELVAVERRKVYESLKYLVDTGIVQQQQDLFTAENAAASNDKNIELCLPADVPLTLGSVKSKTKTKQRENEKQK